MIHYVSRGVNKHVDTAICGCYTGKTTNNKAHTMRISAAHLAAALFAAVATTASALPPTFFIQQIYSNADATVQFVVISDRGMNDCDAGEELWTGQTLVSSGPAPTQVLTFTTICPLARRRAARSSSPPRDSPHWVLLRPTS
jgi:uncharacterized membrane protein